MRLVESTETHCIVCCILVVIELEAIEMSSLIPLRLFRDQVCLVTACFGALAIIFERGRKLVYLGEICRDLR